MTQKHSSLMPTVLVSAGVALAIMGDSALYAVLPTQVDTLGLSASMVGLALSINRFTRLVSNPLAAYLMARRCRRTLFLLALVLAAITTLVWAFPLPMAVLLASRVVWGFCWSILRLTGHLSALTAEPEQRATAFGLFRSVFRVGSLVAAIIAGLLVDKIGFRLLMAVIAGINALGIPAYMRWVPFKDIEDVGPTEGQNSWREWLRSFAGSRDMLLTNMGGLLQWLLSSLLATTMGYHIQQNFSGQLVVIGAATLSGLLNAWLWAGNIGLSPLYGMLMDRLGRRFALILMALLQVLALVATALSPWFLVTVGAIMLGLAASIGMGVLMDTLAGDGAAYSADSGRSLAGYSNWADIGAALGPMIGYSIGVLCGLPVLYVTGAILTVAWVAVALSHMRVEKDHSASLSV